MPRKPRVAKEAVGLTATNAVLIYEPETVTVLESELGQVAERTKEFLEDLDSLAEPSELEVQQMLEARDRSNDPQGPLSAPPGPEVPAAVELPPSNPEGPHALDLAPVNSKVVVTEEGAFLAGPDGVNKLPKKDAANKLPVGARIQKKAELLYRSEQLSPAEDHDPQVYESAREAIQNFINDFHPSGLHA